ncbi:MAG: aminodeoxychorismate/anthranilate synthase component II [Pirellulales bacterium]|nr:aminodeoxychorismate/anthranilate synthase component II [Pirellulales bacterium]
MLLLIDNYDSFTHNLARYCRRLGVDAHIARNDSLSLAQIRALAPRAILLSPGPCGPAQAGICLELVRELHPTTPILGVCLGHQVIAAALGGNIVRAEQPRHGRQSRISHSANGIFAGLPAEFLVGRYHSLIVERQSLPPSLQITATSDEGVIMGLAGVGFPTFGVQFHPESILTEQGYPLLANFLRMVGMGGSNVDVSNFHEGPAFESQNWKFPAGPVTF